MRNCALFKLANILLLFPEAAEDAAEALELNPRNAKAWLRKGYCSIFNVLSVFQTEITQQFYKITPTCQSRF